MFIVVYIHGLKKQHLCMNLHEIKLQITLMLNMLFYQIVYHTIYGMLKKAIHSLLPHFQRLPHVFHVGFSWDQPVAGPYNKHIV